ncbi:L-iditol 2-dehydrogenase [Sphingomonas gilva]|uniref:L-iditol 2-dehydrogenase n=2 Tax=Sphingomonas gilva TaxID=2305907 RepID=A0A396RMW4_9SPHN|nr:L-iditol 2-dehydrogenase [Sphingomonas gilva]
MRAAVIAAPGRAAMASAPLPRPGPGEVRVRLAGCGVCASNLTPWEGPEWMRFPTDPGGLGHEGWGRVDALGAGVTGFAQGDRVAMLSDHAFAEYDVAPQDALARIPPSLPDGPVPAEAIGCAFNIFRRSGVGAGQTVAIVGIGFLGAILTRLATDAGAQVIAVSRRPFSLRLARDHGAAECVAMDDHWAIVEAVKAATEDRLCDVVIEATGKQWPLDLAGELVREGGRLVIAGYHQDGPRQVNMQMWNWKGIDVINAHERDLAVRLAGMREAVEALAAGRIDLDALVTHRFPLDRLGDALDMTRDRPDGFVKAVVLT